MAGTVSSPPHRSEIFTIWIGLAWHAMTLLIDDRSLFSLIYKWNCSSCQKYKKHLCKDMDVFIFCGPSIRDVFELEQESVVVELQWLACCLDTFDVFRLI